MSALRLHRLGTAAMKLFTLVGLATNAFEFHLLLGVAVQMEATAATAATALRGPCCSKGLQGFTLRAIHAFKQSQVRAVPPTMRCQGLPSAALYSPPFGSRAATSPAVSACRGSSSPPPFLDLLEWRAHARSPSVSVDRNIWPDVWKEASAVLHGNRVISREPFGTAALPP